MNYAVLIVATVHRLLLSYHHLTPILVKFNGKLLTAILIYVFAVTDLKFQLSIILMSIYGII